MTPDPLSMPEPTGPAPVVAPAPSLTTQTTTTAAGSLVTDADDRAVSTPGPFVKAGKHLATQTEYPWRTALQSGGITAVATLAAIAGGLSDPTVMALVNRYVPGQSATILGFGVFCGALVTALHRINNIPAVQAALVRLHIGVVPKPKN